MVFRHPGKYDPTSTVASDVKERCAYTISGSFAVSLRIEILAKANQSLRLMQLEHEVQSAVDVED